MLDILLRSFPCASPNDAQTLRNLVNAHVSHPNQLQIDSKAFVSTFAGEACNFGQGSAANGWKTQFTQHPDLQGKIHFVPSFFIDPATFKDFTDVMDGDFNVSWLQTKPIPEAHPFSVEFRMANSSYHLLCPECGGFTGRKREHVKALGSFGCCHRCTYQRPHKLSGK